MNIDMRQTGKKEASQKAGTQAWVKLAAVMLLCYFLPVLGTAVSFLGPVMIPSNPLL